MKTTMEPAFLFSLGCGVLGSRVVGVYSRQIMEE